MTASSSPFQILALRGFSTIPGLGETPRIAENRITESHSGLVRNNMQHKRIMTTSHILTLSCEDRPGLVAAVAGLLFESGGNILEAQQFDDVETGRFFMRILFAIDGESESFRARFAEITTRHGMDWRLRARDERKKVMLLVSKFDHCLGDLLYRA